MSKVVMLSFFIFTFSIFSNAGTLLGYNCSSYSIRISDGKNVYLASGVQNTLAFAKAEIKRICKKAIASGNYENCGSLNCQKVIDDRTEEERESSRRNQSRLLRQIERMQSHSRGSYYDNHRFPLRRREY